MTPAREIQPAHSAEQLRASFDLPAVLRLWGTAAARASVRQIVGIVSPGRLLVGYVFNAVPGQCQLSILASDGCGSAAEIGVSGSNGSLQSEAGIRRHKHQLPQLADGVDQYQPQFRG